MMSKFFIDRPIFAWVISLLIVLVGVMAISQLPVAQYPSVAPPSISINATYAGASAEVLHNTVTSIIEQSRLRSITALYFIYQQFQRTSHHHALFRAWYQSRHRPGSGAK